MVMQWPVSEREVDAPPGWEIHSHRHDRDLGAGVRTHRRVLDDGGGNGPVWVRADLLSFIRREIRPNRT